MDIVQWSSSPGTLSYSSSSMTTSQFSSALIPFAIMSSLLDASVSSGSSCGKSQSFNLEASSLESMALPLVLVFSTPLSCESTFTLAKELSPSCSDCRKSSYWVTDGWKILSIVNWNSQNPSPHTQTHKTTPTTGNKVMKTLSNVLLSIISYNNRDLVKHHYIFVLECRFKSGQNQLFGSCMKCLEWLILKAKGVWSPTLYAYLKSSLDHVDQVNRIFWKLRSKLILNTWT